MRALLILLPLSCLPACLTSDKAFAHLSSVHERTGSGKVKYRTEVPSQSGFRRLFTSRDDPPMKSVGDPIVFCLENLDALAGERYASLDDALPVASLLLEMAVEDPVPVVRARALELLVDTLVPFHLTAALASVPYDKDAGKPYYESARAVEAALRAQQDLDEATRQNDQAAARALGKMRPVSAASAREFVTFLAAEMAWRSDPESQRAYRDALRDQLPYATLLAGHQALADANPPLRVQGARAVLMLDRKSSAAAAINGVFRLRPGETDTPYVARVGLLRALEEFQVPLESLTVALAQALLNETESVDGAVSFHARQRFAAWLGIAATAPVEEVGAALTAFFASHRGLDATSPGGP